MAFIKLTLSEDELDTLQEIAKEKNMGVQDYIRLVLFNKKSIFTPEEAENRARKLPKDYGSFSLSDLYTAEEWGLISSGEAGVFGRRFYKFSLNSKYIEFVGMGNRRAKYVVKEDNNE
ncbi:MAG: hypothetical protein LIO40_05325 [Ruminococcus sp.]|nr:hypothetical protein [Ruminococcus sp.]